MTNTVHTIDVLLALGFIEQQHELIYTFDNCELKAIPAVNKRLQPCIVFLGLLKDQNNINYIDFELPQEFESLEQCLAILSFCLKSYPLRKKTFWLIAHETYKQELPWIKEKAMYDEIPKAHIDDDWFKPIIKNLKLLYESNNPNDTITSNFDGSILSFTSGETILACAAKGEKWETEFTFQSSQLSGLPKRIKRGVHIIYHRKNQLFIDNYVIQSGTSKNKSN